MGVRRTGRFRGTRDFGLLGLSLWCVGSLSACAPSDPASAAPVAEQGGNLVQLDLTYTRELSAALPTTLAAEAHFVRYHAADRTVDAAAVASLLGLGDDASLAVESCRVDEAAVNQGVGAVDVALLDAGALTLRGVPLDEANPDPARSPTATQAVLAPQRYPELSPFVSGVVYGLDTELSQKVEPGTRVEIEAEGGEDVGPFVAAATLPDAFPELSATRNASGDVELRWQIGQAAKPTTTSSLVELRWTGVRAGALRCRATDDGSFTIDHRLVPGLAAAIDAGARAQVSLARSRRSDLAAPGAGSGTLSVTLRDVATLAAERTP
jgi:hypothetical protein